LFLIWWRVIVVIISRCVPIYIFLILANKGIKSAGVALDIKLGRGRRRWDTLDDRDQKDMPCASMKGWGGFVGRGPANIIVAGGRELFSFSTEALAKSPSTFSSSLLVDIAASSFIFLEDSFCFMHY
jgi:hypothetical protein